MTLPIDRTTKAALDANLVNGNTSDAPVIKSSNDVVYNTIDELNNKVDGLIAAGALSPYPPCFLSRQAIINGNFDVPQRGTTFTNPTGNQYTLDRWQFLFDANGGTLPTTITNSQLVLNPGDIQGSAFADRLNTDGAGSAFGTNAYYIKAQKIENGVRYLCGSGKKVTVSFWARSTIAGKRIGVGLRQDYGSGGTPSLNEDLKTEGQIITLTPTWTKYSITFTMITTSGKMFGTNTDDNLRLSFFYMWGSSIATSFFQGGATAESFVGAGNIDIAQVQFNAGEVALPFQPRTFAEELALCRRYLYVIDSSENANGPFCMTFHFTTTLSIGVVKFPVKMRTKPTLTSSAASTFLLLNNGSSTVLSAAPSTNQSTSDTISLNLSASSLTVGQGGMLAAQATTAALLRFDAEL